MASEDMENGDVGEPLVKSEPAIDELNSKLSHDVLSGDAPAEAPIAEPLEADPQPTPADEGQDAQEQVEAEHLSEAITQVVLEDEGANPNISEEEPAVEDSVPVPVPGDDLGVVEEKGESSGNAREVAYSVVPSLGDENENEEVMPEVSGEESNGKVDGEAVEEGEEVVEGGSSAALPEEELAEVEGVPAPADDVEVNADHVEVIAMFEGADKEEANPEVGGEESSEKVGGGGLAEKIDVDESAEEELAEKADGEELAVKVEAEESAKKVDGEESSEKVVSEESAEKFDVEESAERIDGGGLAEKVDVDESAEEESAENIDGEELAEKVGVDESAQEESAEKIDGEELAKKVEAEESAQEESTEKVDLEDSGKEVDGEESFEKVDGQELDEKVDSEESAEKVEAEELAENFEADKSAKEVDGEESAERVVSEESAEEVSAEKVDGEELAEKADGEELAEKIDGEELAEKVDVDESAQEESAEKIDGEELGEKVDVDESVQEESAEKIDGEELGEKVDVDESAQEESAEKIDGEELGEKVDVDGSAQEESAEKIDGEELGEKVDVDGSAQEESAEKIDGEELAEKVDEESAEKIDGEELGEKVDVDGSAQEESAEKIDGEELAEKVEAEELAENFDVDESAESVDAEESAEKADGEVLDAPVEEDVAAPVNAEAMEESESLEAVAAPSDDVEEKSVEVDSRDLSEVPAEVPSESGDNVDEGPEVPVEELAEYVGREGIDVPVEEIEEVVEPSPNAESVEEAASLEFVSAPSDDVEEKALEVNSEDASEMPTTPESAVKDDASPEIPVDSEVIDAPGKEVEEAVSTGEEPVELEAVSSPSDDVEDKALEMTTPPPSDGTDNVDSKALDVGHVEGDQAVEAEESARLESVSAPSDDVQDRSVEMNFEDANKALDAPVEELSEATSAFPGAEEPAGVESMPASSDDSQSTSEEAKPEVETTSSPLPADEELFDLSESLMPRYEQNEASDEAPAENGANHTPRELSDFAMSADVPEIFQDLSKEAPSYASGSADEEMAQTDRGLQVEGLPEENEAEPESTSRGVSVDAEEEEAIAEGDVAPSESLSVAIEGASEAPSDAVAEPCDEDPLTEELVHPTAYAFSIPSIVGVEARELPSIESTDDDDDADDGLAANVALQSVGDVSHLLQSEMTEQEVKLAAFYDDLEESAGAETAQVESFLAVGDAQVNQVESVSRGFNLDDFVSESPSTSGEVALGSSDESHKKVPAPYLATALATASSEKNDGPPKSSYRHPDLDEVAANLHDAAEKALENVKSSDAGERQDSVAQSVAQIVLDESSKTGDSSQYIAGVVQHVGQYAQDASKANPSALPDTVSRVFVRDASETPADPNQVSQPKETTSLGTMVSLFVIWCVSICASHISSKDMPAPALKLAAEEVAAVLHSNAPAPPAPAQETATSSHCATQR